MVNLLKKWVPSMEEGLVGASVGTLESAVESRFPMGFWEGRERMGRDFFAFERLMYSVRGDVDELVEATNGSIDESQILILRQATAKVWEEMRGEILPLWWSWLVTDAQKTVQILPALVYGSAPELLTDLRDIVVSAQLTTLILQDKEVPNTIKDALRGVLAVNQIVDAQWIYSYDQKNAVLEAEFLVRRWSGIIALMAHEVGLEKLMKFGFDPIVVSDVLVSNQIVRNESWCARNLGQRLLNEVGYEAISQSDNLYPIFWVNIPMNAKYAELLMRIEQVYLAGRMRLSSRDLIVKGQGISDLAMALRTSKLPSFSEGNGRQTSWQTAIMSRMPLTASLLDWERKDKGIPELLGYEFNSFLNARHPSFEHWANAMEMILEGGVYQYVKDGWSAEKRQVLARYLRLWWVNMVDLQGANLKKADEIEFEIACMVEIGLIAAADLINERHETVVDMVENWKELIEIHGMTKVKRMLRRLRLGTKARKQEIVGKVLWEQVMGEQEVGEDGWERWKKGLGNYVHMARRKRERRSAL